MKKGSAGSSEMATTITTGDFQDASPRSSLSKNSVHKKMKLKCDETLRRHIKRNLENFEIRPHELQGTKRAAVAVTVVEVFSDPERRDLPLQHSRDSTAALILTQRAFKLKSHAGQWAFPGGRMDDGETPEETALRELAEEVGLQLESDRVVGRLDDFSTRSGFTIKPVVVWGGPCVGLTPNPDEVASIHRIPITEFLRDDAPVLENIPESRNPVLLMPVGESWIAAPTAAVLYQFREVAILGKDTRVAHYEQPIFAWR